MRPRFWNAEDLNATQVTHPQQACFKKANTAMTMTWSAHSRMFTTPVKLSILDIATRTVMHMGKPFYLEKLKSMQFNPFLAILLVLQSVSRAYYPLVIHKSASGALY